MKEIWITFLIYLKLLNLSVYRYKITMFIQFFYIIFVYFLLTVFSNVSRILQIY